MWHTSWRSSAQPHRFDHEGGNSAEERGKVIRNRRSRKMIKWSETNKAGDEKSGKVQTPFSFLIWWHIGAIVGSKQMSIGSLYSVQFYQNCHRVVSPGRKGPVSWTMMRYSFLGEWRTKRQWCVWHLFHTFTTHVPIICNCIILYPFSSNPISSILIVSAFPEPSTKPRVPTVVVDFFMFHG